MGYIFKFHLCHLYKNLSSLIGKKMYIFKILEAVCLNYFVSVKHEEVLLPIHLITEQQMGNIIMLPSTLALYCHTNGTLLTGISSTVWCFLTSCQLAYSSQMFVLREKEMAKSFGNNNTTTVLILILILLIATTMISLSIKMWYILSQTLCSFSSALRLFAILHSTSENRVADCLG